MSAHLHTAADIVKSIRATDANGKPVLSDSEAVLMLTLYASVKVETAKLEHDPFPKNYSV